MDIGYDILSKGSDDARNVTLDYFNNYYGFPKDVLNSMKKNSCITGGGMRGLKDIADSLILKAKKYKTSHRFIQPDNSFGTWWNIIERPDTDDKNRREIFTIETKQENKLHITSKDISKFYDDVKPSQYESWYITPIGNPSGTKIKGKQLYESCKAILHYNPEAIIILDAVYTRTLLEEDAKDVFSGVANDKSLLKRTIFVESYSKSHGLCRERLGLYFSFNEELFTEMHIANISYSAGPGTHKDYQFLALGTMKSDIQKGITDLQWFWTKERKGLIKYLLRDQNKHIFSTNQSHLRDEDVDRPCTLYILLKVNEGIKAQYVFEQTGILGVDTPLKSGHYIRFSVGTLKEPVFSKYLKDH